jgi:hypothetical protein
LWSYAEPAAASRALYDPIIGKLKEITRPYLVVGF